MIIHKGYYLVDLNPEGQIISYDGSHSTPKDVTHAHTLWTKLNFIKPGHSYKMIKLKKDVETSYSMLEMIQMLHEEGFLELKEIKDSYKYKKPRKINEEAINIINGLKVKN